VFEAKRQKSRVAMQIVQFSVRKCVVTYCTVFIYGENVFQIKYRIQKRTYRCPSVWTVLKFTRLKNG